MGIRRSQPRRPTPKNGGGLARRPHRNGHWGTVALSWDVYATYPTPSPWVYDPLQESPLHDAVERTDFVPGGR